ncbi:MAG TPA: hypothetical protein VN372_03380, partial [Methanospirillum sp.]|nr:hypothetical protein [Methanospirillum sp.]
LGNNNVFQLLFNKAYQLSNDNSSTLKRKTIQLLKNLIETHDPALIQKGLQLIIAATSKKYEIFIRPMVKALRIIQEKDTDIYFRELQAEERQIVAEIVRKIMNSKDLVPPEFNSK